MVSPQVKRDAVKFLTHEQNLKRHRALKLVGLNSSTFYYQSNKQRDDLVLQSKLIELAQVRVSWGLPRLYVLLRREGFTDNYKRVERIYKQSNLVLSKRKSKKKRSHLRLVLPEPAKPNEIWSMDFMSDTLFDGRRFRTFNLVDEFTRENLTIHVNRSIRSHNVVELLNTQIKAKGKPKMIVCDNGPEFDSHAIDKWAYENNVEIKFIDPGKPYQNAYIESFNGKFRDECLNKHWFLNLDHARVETELWRKDYNETRPHSSLKMKTPNEFANEFNFMISKQLN